MKNKRNLTFTYLLAALLFLSCKSAEDTFSTKDQNRFGGGSGGTPTALLPVLTGLSIVSPSNSNTPSVLGTTREDASVEFFSDSGCTSSLGLGTADSNGDFNVSITVPSDAVTNVYGQATDTTTLEVSACTTAFLTYTEDSTAPSVPTVSTTTPVSPASPNNPTVDGTGDANETVRIYSDSGCSSLVSSGTISGGGSFSISSTVTEDTTTTFYADSIDAAGNASACSGTTVSYTTYSIPVGAARIEGSQTTNSTNLNQGTAYPMQWDTSSYVDYDYFTHSTSTNPEIITVKQAGNYMVSYTIPITGSVTRGAVRGQVYVNGVTAISGTIAESTYIRNTSGHNESSLHMTYVLEGLSMNDTIEVQVQQGAAAGTLTVQGQAIMQVEYLSGTRNVFSATATRTVNSTNLNSTSSPLEWTEGLETSDFTHDDVTNPENIGINTTGEYLVYVNIPLTSTVQRANINAAIQVDDVTVPGGLANQGYIRAASGHNRSTVHWFGLVQIGAGSTLTIKPVQEGAAGIATVPGGEVASIFIERVTTSSNFLYLRGNDLSGGTNWNPAASQSVAWATQSIIDTGVFSHDTITNNHQITLLADGDYVMTYTDSLTSTVQRAAPVITVSVNGTPVDGAEVNTHYIRSSSGHNEASGTLHFYFKDLSNGDVITVDVVQGAVAGTVNDTSEATLTMWKKD